MDYLDLHTEERLEARRLYAWHEAVLADPDSSERDRLRSEFGLRGLAYRSNHYHPMRDLPADLEPLVPGSYWFRYYWNTGELGKVEQVRERIESDLLDELSD